MLCLILCSNTHRTLEIRKNIFSTKTCLHSVRYYWSAMEFFGKQMIRTEHRRLTQNELQVCFSYKILYSENEKASHPIQFFFLTGNFENTERVYVEDGITNLLSKLSVNPNATGEKLDPLSSMFFFTEAESLVILCTCI